MQINVRLFGPLRDKLSPEAKGRITLTLDEGASVQAIFDALDLSEDLLITINQDDSGEPDSLLHDGDQVILFAAVNGG